MGSAARALIGGGSAMNGGVRRFGRPLHKPRSCPHQCSLRSTRRFPKPVIGCGVAIPECGRRRCEVTETPGWHEDPFGQHQERFFNERGEPTRLVRTGNVYTLSPESASPLADGADT